MQNCYNCNGHVHINATISVSTAIGAGIIIGWCGTKLLTFLASHFRILFFTAGPLIRTCSHEKHEKHDEKKDEKDVEKKD